MKITAVFSGGDWADASVDFFVLAPGMEVVAEKAAYSRARGNGMARTAGINSFAEWLRSRGAREPTFDELESIED